MNTKLLALVGFRIAATVFIAQGKSEEAKLINALIRAVQAGRNVDAEMQRFADLLGTEGEPEMQELINDLNFKTEEFLSRGSDGQLPGG